MSALSWVFALIKLTYVRAQNYISVTSVLLYTVTSCLAEDWYQYKQFCSECRALHPDFAQAHLNFETKGMRPVCRT